jgi:hypothetical protein
MRWGPQENFETEADPNIVTSFATQVDEQMDQSEIL